jgi:toxoflavin biosynthesis protein ToxD
LDGIRKERTQEQESRLWSALIGPDTERREEAARTICALEQETDYGRELLAALHSQSPHERCVTGDAISLLGDMRFSPPYFISEMLPVPGELEPFALSQMPVTNAAYAIFVKSARHRSPRGWRHNQPPLHLRNAPVTWISVHDAEAYCRWLSAETGFTFRLPSEREWVLSACSGDVTRKYPWGSEFCQECANVWGRHAARRMSAVGLFPDGAGPYGHLDLIGNVWEWCSASHSQMGGTGDLCVMRGGSWRSKPGAATCTAARQTARATDSYEVVGFRLARDTHV